MTLRPIRRALLSVSDKTGLVEFAHGLAHHRVALISTGGTAKTLRDAGLAVTEVAELTGFPEILDGRVKTLHPRIHGGLLARRDKPEHVRAMREHNIDAIDLLVCNLYPFESAVAARASFDEAIETIDIGGPALIRAAAKNHDWVTVIVDPEDYERVLTELGTQGGAMGPALRRELAQTAFARTAAYDAAISNWLSHESEQGGERTAPRRYVFAGRLGQSLRYGENPHQRAAFYRTDDARFGVATARQMQGKALSYNNINDTDAACELAAEFHPATHAVCVIVKHANPCGVALAATPREAYAKARACDPVSAFGGIVAFNRTLDAATAEDVARLFTEVITAPDASEKARAILSAKKNLRLLLTGGLPDPAADGTGFKSVSGGFLVQSRDTARVARSDLRIVTRRQPTANEIADMLFAFAVCKHVKSNAIVYAKDLQTVGIGAGQMSRVDAARMAAMKAREAAAAADLAQPLTIGSAAASDAYFPFPDGLQAVAEAGATAVIQPGGSIRDDAVIKAADDVGLAMAFTGVRHFRH